MVLKLLITIKERLSGLTKSSGNDQGSFQKPLSEAIFPSSPEVAKEGLSGAPIVVPTLAANVVGGSP